MNAPYSPSSTTTGWVRQLDDATLRREHPLLDDDRVQGFSVWMERQLERLESRFHEYATPQSFRKSLGRR